MAVSIPFAVITPASLIAEMKDLFLESLESRTSSPYGLLAFVALLLSFLYWTRAGRNEPRLVPVYLGALAGAFLGAKISYLISEAWLHTGSDWWVHWIYEKSITGALLGGYLGVEMGKKLVGYRNPTGDRFALIVPLGIIIGRLGCLHHCCCQGVVLNDGFHWPAIYVEISFNLLIWIIFLTCHLRDRLQDQLFHLHLISYGLFRFGHEFLRDTPKVIGPISGYQLFALALFILGLERYRSRQVETQKKRNLN